MKNPLTIRFKSHKTKPHHREPRLCIRDNKHTRKPLKAPKITPSRLLISNCTHVPHNTPLAQFKSTKKLRSLMPYFSRQRPPQATPPRDDAPLNILFAPRGIARIIKDIARPRDNKKRERERKGGGGTLRSLSRDSSRVHACAHSLQPRREMRSAYGLSACTYMCTCTRARGYYNERNDEAGTRSASA